MTHISGNRYRVGLIMYFDAVNGNPGAIDPTVTVHIFEKATSALKRSIEMPLLQDDFVNYTQPECAVGDLVTRRIYYAAEVVFNTQQYTNPLGYYMVWERCCRNRTIDNIIAPEDAGQTFYMEFPPMQNGRTQFINSSPRLFPPLSDYACANQSFVFDFSGTDDDGDQLTYRLTTPIQGNSTPDNPVAPAIPAPYERVRFVGGITEANMIPGNPPLSINANTGILTLNAARPGLYVFAVTVEERRGGVKIGEVRREYQLLVLDCPRADAPEIVFIPPGSNRPYRPGEVIKIKAGEEACGQLQINDPNSDTQLSGQISPLDFDEIDRLVTSNPQISGTLAEGGTYTQELCLFGCPDPSGQSLFQLQVIVGDNSCSVPLFDTLNILVEIDQSTNIPPTVTSNQINPPRDTEECATQSVLLGETLSFDVIADDENGDQITLEAQGLTAGMQFAPQAGAPPLQSRFSWAPQCSDLPNEVDSLVQRVQFITADGNRCLDPTYDTLCVDITLRRPQLDNQDPLLSSTLPQNADSVYIDSVQVGQFFDFPVLAQDPDGDSLTLSLTGIGNDPQSLGVSFAPTSGRERVESRFRWRPGCDALDDPQTPQTYRFRVIVTDYDFCGEAQGQDTLLIELRVLPEPNRAPLVSTDFRFDPITNTYTDTIRLTETLTFNLFGDDPDGDSLLLTGSGLGFSLTDLGMEFGGATGFPRLVAPFRWQTSCDLQERVEIGRPYEILFLLRDFNFCPENDRQDTLRVRIVVLPPEDLNSPPTVRATAPLAEANRYRDTILIGQTITFDVLAQDPERDRLRLDAIGRGFALPQIGMDFPAPQTGNAPLQGTFRWAPSCNLLPAGGGDTTFVIDFITTEIGRCGDLQSDTIEVALTLILSPTNRPPEALTDLPQLDAQTRTYTVELIVNETLNFTVTGTDPDADLVFLSGRGEGFNFADLGMQFEGSSGMAPIESPFTWTPDCAVLEGQAERTFEVLFAINDISDACNDDLYDQTRVRIIVRDNPEEIDFQPYNVFTPNGDGFNDTFTLPERPISCRNAFERILIYNRWGKEVFSDTREDFSWDGGDFPDGVYFYQIIYERATFKGSVSLVRGE